MTTGLTWRTSVAVFAAGIVLVAVGLLTQWPAQADAPPAGFPVAFDAPELSSLSVSLPTSDVSVTMFSDMQ